MEIKAIWRNICLLGVLQFFQAGLALECYQCVHISDISMQSGSSSSVNRALSTYANQECAALGANANQASADFESKSGNQNISRTQCPNGRYVCGFTHAKVNMQDQYGQFAVQMHVHDCLELRDEEYIGCYAGGTAMRRLIQRSLPPSTSVKYVSGKECLCDTDHCMKEITDTDMNDHWCHHHAVKIGDKCVNWWVLTLASVDTFLLTVILSVVACYCLNSCPLFSRQRSKLRREESVEPPEEFDEEIKERQEKIKQLHHKKLGSDDINKEKLADALNKSYYFVPLIVPGFDNFKIHPTPLESHI